MRPAGQGRSLTVVTNTGAGELARSIGGINGAEEVSLVLVVEESYGPGWDEGLSLNYRFAKQKKIKARLSSARLRLSRPFPPHGPASLAT